MASGICPDNVKLHAFDPYHESWNNYSDGMSERCKECNHGASCWCHDKAGHEAEVNRLSDELLNWLDDRYGAVDPYFGGITTKKGLALNFEQTKLTFRTMVKALLEAYTS